MKTKNPTELSSSLNITPPKCWRELTDAQLLYYARVSAEHEWKVDELLTQCFFRFVGLTPVPPKLTDQTVCYSDEKKNYIAIPDKQIAVASTRLEFLTTPPDFPVRPSKLEGANAVDAELHGVSFSDYLAAENLYQAFLMTKNNDALDALAKILYPGIALRPDAAQRYCLVLWMVGLKALFSREFPDLFKPSGGSGESPDLRAVMDAQIRALTGGDITKEETVLAADTWRALTELNAKAREAEEFNKLK